MGHVDLFFFLMKLSVCIKVEVAEVSGRAGVLCYHRADCVQCSPRLV